MGPQFTRQKYYQKIGSPLGCGLKSRVLWGIYIKPDTPYRVAKFIFDRQNPEDSKVRQCLQKMVKDGFACKDSDGRYHANVDKIIECFVDEISQCIYVDDLTKHILTKLIDSKFVRTVFDQFYSVQKIEKIEHKDVSFTLHLKTFLAQTANGMIKFQHDYPGYSIWLENTCRTINKKINYSKKNTKPILKDELFDYYLRSIENVFNNPEQFEDFRKHIRNAPIKDHSYAIYTLYLMILLKIPREILLKMTLLNHDAVFAHNHVFEMMSS